MTHLLKSRYSSLESCSKFRERNISGPNWTSEATEGKAAWNTDRDFNFNTEMLCLEDPYGHTSCTNRAKVGRNHGSPLSTQHAVSASNTRPYSCSSSSSWWPLTLSKSSHGWSSLHRFDCTHCKLNHHQTPNANSRMAKDINSSQRKNKMYCIISRAPH